MTVFALLNNTAVIFTVHFSLGTYESIYLGYVYMEVELPGEVYSPSTLLAVINCFPN